jgi:hypothetical protein
MTSLRLSVLRSLVRCHTDAAKQQLVRLLVSETDPDVLREARSALQASFPYDEDLKELLEARHH